MSADSPQRIQREMDETFMQRALALATETIGLASPNPQVGCVLTKNSLNGTYEIIGEGAHFYDHRDHAEIVALKQAAARGIPTRGATAYVTLEPCSHHGRTPPCANALIEAGIARCVIATQDPNPLVSGGTRSGEGIASLRAAGIEVTLGVLQEQARTLNDGFARFIQHRTPFVTLKAALSADGKLAPPPASRLPNQPHWLTGPAARHQVQLLRHASDAVLTGIGTVLADDPQLTDRSGMPRRRPLLRVILDTHLRIPLDSQLVRSANNTSNSEPNLLILCCEVAPTTKRTALEKLGAQVETLPGDTDHLSLPAVLSALAKRNILSLLLECGSHLNRAFIRQNLVDKAVLFYAQTELGDQAIPFAEGINPLLFENSLSRVNRANYSTDACVTGYLHYPWPNP